jgi:signal peptidase I
MKTRQWIGILAGATILALSIRIFLFEPVRVAGNAVSDNRPAGDRLLIEKWSLGARLPQSIGLPFAPDQLFGYYTYRILSEETKRTPAFGTIKRNDLLAYNDPTSTDCMERAPILLSRCVGLPGDAFILYNGRTTVNKKKTTRHPDASFCYSFPVKQLETLKKVLIACHFNENQPLYRDKDSGFVYLTRHEWLCLYRIRNQTSIVLTPRFSKYDSQNLHIPSKGSKIELNDSTFRIYGETLNRYEQAGLTLDTAGNVLKNGHKVRFHTFRDNYYFLLNDHQGFLNDSRKFGLVPERYLIGKAWMVLLSPSSKRFLEQI